MHMHIFINTFGKWSISSIFHSIHTGPCNLYGSLALAFYHHSPECSL